MLRRDIYNGHLAPGARLVENDLTERFGVSHIPIREALARLSEEGLIDRIPRRGARVASTDLRTLEEISDVRRLLEQHVVELVQQRWSAEAARELTDIVQTMQQRAASGDAEGVFDLDREFHERLWELSGNSILVGVAAHLRSRINRFLLAANRALSRQSLRGHAASHLRLLEAISSGEPERARSEMVAHIDVALSRVKSSLPSSELSNEPRSISDELGSRLSGHGVDTTSSLR